MIEVVSLTPEHLATFESETPLPTPIPEDQFGRAAVGLKDDQPLGICFVWENGGAAEIVLALSPAARKYPVTLHRLAKQMLAGLHRMGHQCIRTTADTEIAERWLYRLGFQQVNGALEKWL